MHAGIEIYLNTLTSALDGGEWSQPPCPGHITPQGKSPWYPLDKRLDECDPLWILWRKENSPLQSEIKPQSPGHTAYSLITILTELS
jgi:hypothetical protein